MGNGVGSKKKHLDGLSGSGFMFKNFVNPHGDVFSGGKRSTIDFLVLKSKNRGENDVSCGPTLTLVGVCHQACIASRCRDMMDKDAFAEGTRNQPLSD